MVPIFVRMTTIALERAFTQHQTVAPGRKHDLRSHGIRHEGRILLKNSATQKSPRKLGTLFSW
jgi:hypothetical protein